VSLRSMTLANQLTMLRFVMALAMFAALLQPQAAAHLAAFTLFIAAIVTDWVDGYVARLTHSVSPFGKVADPIADKILVIGALIGLQRASAGIPLWAVFLIIARELLMGGIRVLTITQQGQILAAERWGKISMGVQSGAVLVMLGLLVLHERFELPAAVLRLPYLLTVLCVLMAWSSAYLYMRQSRKLIEKSWR
jgi:CDP-diacylglycerol---glycerol-3-phosphate 3-phosphatidyltransferase